MRGVSDLSGAAYGIPVRCLGAGRGPAGWEKACAMSLSGFFSIPPQQQAARACTCQTRQLSLQVSCNRTCGQLKSIQAKRQASSKDCIENSSSLPTNPALKGHVCACRRRQGTRKRGRQGPGSRNRDPAVWSRAWRQVPPQQAAEVRLGDVLCATSIASLLRNRLACI